MKMVFQKTYTQNVGSPQIANPYMNIIARPASTRIQFNMIENVQKGTNCETCEKNRK